MAGRVWNLGEMVITIDSNNLAIIHWSDYGVSHEYRITHGSFWQLLLKCQKNDVPQYPDTYRSELFPWTTKTTSLGIQRKMVLNMPSFKAEMEKYG